jgi:hypothetical protein
MKSYLKHLLWKFQSHLLKYAEPEKDYLISYLIMNCASLELSKGEFVEFAPIRGCCGPFKLYGNGLPSFKYTVFSKPMMEFISVRVEISKPDRIDFIAQIESTTAPERNGEVVPVIDKYKEPFNQLSKHLYRYFGHYVSPQKRNSNG